MADKRKFPRSNICSKERVIQVTSANRAEKNLVLSKDISASGFSFRTSTLYPENSLMMAHLDEEVFDDLKMNRAQVMKYGRYFLARVVWSKLLTILENPLYEVGCAFVGLSEGDPQKLELFTRLVNFDTAEQLSADSEK